MRANRLFIPTVVETVTTMLGVQQGGACSEDCRVCVEAERREACMGAKGSRPGCARVGAEGETEHGAERRKVLRRRSGSKHSRSCRRK
jgi:hypothetical protein